MTKSRRANRTAVRLGVLSGSLLSGIVGYATLRWLAGSRRTALSQEP